MSVELDLTACPFSRFGSYFSLSGLTGDRADLGDGLYLHTHHGGSARLFKVEPTRSGAPVEYEITARPTGLALSSGEDEIRIVISDGGSVRFLGTGLGLRLEMPPARWRFAYRLASHAWAFNAPKSGTQVALESIKGDLQMDAPWEQGEGFCYVTTTMVAQITPAEDGTFEAAVDDFSTTWIRPDRLPFDQCEREAQDAFGEWRDGLPEVDASLGAVRELAGYVNWSATVRPSGNLTRTTMLMSKMSMCNVFGWDHAFNAMALCSHDPDLAWDQMMVFAEKEDSFGKPPDNMNDRDIMYTFSKPPIHGWALRRMWDENPSLLTAERQEEAYLHLSRWTNWWTDHRTWEGTSLPHYIHGFDSGWDNSTIFDAGTPLAAPDLAAYLVIQQEVLGELAEALGDRDGARAWRQKSEATLESLLGDLWLDGGFVGRIRPSGKPVTSESLIACMPIVLGRRLPAHVREPLVTRIRGHLTDWGLATEKPTSPKYRENGYWRGPIWAPPTLLAISGLADIGEDDLARQIARGYIEMCARSGFAENFDALTGAGHFDPAYTWTSSVFLILASQYARRGRG